MALLTATDLRGHVETDLDDAALQPVIDRVDADLVRRAGPHAGPLTELLSGGARTVYVSRPVAQLSAVREGDRIQATTPALDPDRDLRLWAAEGRIERRPAGTTFAGIVEVVYDPLDETERRKRVLLELVRLDLAQSGRASEAIGEYRYRGLDYAARRETLIREARAFLVLE